MRRTPTAGRMGRALELGAVATGAAVGGALVGHLLDPDRGRARRTRLRDQIRGVVHGALHRARQLSARLVRHRLDHWRGLARARVLRLFEGRAAPDDTVLVQKIKSEVLGRLEGADHIAVESLDGRVSLRGEVGTVDEMRRIVTGVERVRGVRAVHSLLHRTGDPRPDAVLPGEPGAP